MSTATAVELGIVIEDRSFGRVPGAQLITGAVEAVGQRRRQVARRAPEIRNLQVAADAWRRFGKGRHAAALNLGDCFSCATAHIHAVPLLCVGDDFTRTDLEVLRPG